MILEDQKNATKVTKYHRIICNEGTGEADVYLHPFYPRKRVPVLTVHAVGLVAGLDGRG